MPRRSDPDLYDKPDVPVLFPSLGTALQAQLFATSPTHRPVTFQPGKIKVARAWIGVLAGRVTVRHDGNVHRRHAHPASLCRVYGPFVRRPPEESMNHQPLRLLPS